MSKPEAEVEQPDRAALKELENAVGEALDRMQELRTRASHAEGTSAELSEMLKRFTGDEGEAGRLLTRLRTLEAENAELRDRVQKGREGVERLLAKIRFLEEQR